MDLRSGTGAARASNGWRHLAYLSITAGSMMLAAAGCSYFGTKAAATKPATQQQLEAYAQEQTALRRDASHPNGELGEHCDELATVTPGVEEIRNNAGVVESRQWTLVANGSSRSWVYVRPVDGSSDGWAPKPGIDKLNFQPPIEPALAGPGNHFLAYAPIDGNAPDDGQRSAIARAVFGAAQGEFTWHGRKYSYIVAPELPCFPQLQ